MSLRIFPFKIDYQRGRDAISPLTEAGIVLGVLGGFVAAIVLTMNVVRFVEAHAAWVPVVLACVLPVGFALWVLLGAACWCVRMHRWTRDWWRGRLPRED